MLKNQKIRPMSNALNTEKKQKLKYTDMNDNKKDYSTRYAWYST